VAGTVARGQLRDDELLYTGRVDGRYSEVFPFPIDRAVLERGRQRFNIYCSVCHDQLGNGQGMIVQRGFRPPPSLHEERLRKAPPGLLFDVITNGFGVMWSYADRIETRDRWAIAAYIQALQLSQNARIEDLPEAERSRLSRKGS
jgi:cytochrome c553